MLRWITPAWAGKSITLPFQFIWQKDHPRVGGEKFTRSYALAFQLGSPPRGRGKVSLTTARTSITRITPAWAGKSQHGAAERRVYRDHPRVGGEKLPIDKMRFFGYGSPPRGRGKGIGFRYSSKRLRITPAWAGKRLKRSHRSGIFISGPIPFHSVLHRPAGSGGSRAGRGGSPAGQPQNAGPA